MDILQSREDYRLKLRKEKLEEHFIAKRKSLFHDIDLKFVIKTQLFMVPQSFKDSLWNSDCQKSQMISILNCLESQNEEVIKFGLSNLRIILSVDENFNIDIIDDHIIYALLKFVKTSDDLSIIVSYLSILV